MDPIPQHKMPDYKDTNKPDLSSWVEIQPHDINPPIFTGSPTTAKTTMPLAQMDNLEQSANAQNKIKSIEAKKESFVESLNFANDKTTGLTATTDNIVNSNLTKNWTTMTGDEKYDMSRNVVNPYGYGYVPSLEETRNTDAIDLYQQENATFIIGAITGVSLIVLGILVASNSSASE